MTVWPPSNTWRQHNGVDISTNPARNQSRAHCQVIAGRQLTTDTTQQQLERQPGWKHSTAQHSAAQHSAAQHSAAQRSAAQVTSRARSEANRQLKRQAMPQTRNACRGGGSTLEGPSAWATARQVSSFLALILLCSVLAAFWASMLAVLPRGSVSVSSARPCG